MTDYEVICLIEKLARSSIGGGSPIEKILCEVHRGISLRDAIEKENCDEKRTHGSNI